MSEHRTKYTGEGIEKVCLDSDGHIISLDVKKLYTYVPLKEAINIAYKNFYEPEKPPDIASKTMKALLNFAVGQVHFKYTEEWFGY